MGARFDLETGGLDCLAEPGGVALKLVAQLRAALEQIEHRDRRADDHRRHRVREQIGSRALPQQLDHLAPAAGKAARCTAERLAQGAGDDVDFAENAAVLMGAATGAAKEPAGVAFVDTEQRAESIADFTDLIELGDRAVHREHAVGENQGEACTGVPGFFQAALQISHVVMLVAVALRFAQPDAVDDRGMVQLIADHRVFFAQQRFEQAAIGVEGRRIENRVLSAEKTRQTRLEGLVQILCATDEAYRGQAIAMAAQGLMRCGDHLRMTGQPQIVVGAEIEQLAT